MDSGLFVLLCFIGGGFSIAGAVNDWDWFFNSSRARLFVSLFGREGARGFYIFLGVILLIMGLGFMATGG